MNTQTQTKPDQTKQSQDAPNVVWFEIPADNVERAKKFYGALFGWKMEKFPAAVHDYWVINTGNGEDKPAGGLMPRMHSHQPITSYVAVPSVDESAAKVQKLGGKIMKPKTAVPHMGYFAICTDTENNEFALWQCDENAE
jgi:uncharacterized protein